MNESDKLTLRNADLLIDNVYEGGRLGNASDDPLNPLIGVSNQGGFRYIGTKETPKLVVITSTLKDLDWPDDLDKENGIYTYFGDNKKPGHELHDTPRFGNLLLRDIFENSHQGKEERLVVPPILVFTNTGNYRDVQFLGLAVPGGQNLNSNTDLVAVWKLRDGKRFQNYQARFTILDVPVVSRKWIEDIKLGNPLTSSCPPAWRLWVESRLFKPLKAPRALRYRTREEQLPTEDDDIRIIKTIQSHFSDDPVRFEACAAKIAELMMPSIVLIDITRPTRDGGRDAIGKFKIGEGDSSVLVDFSLEAKCYDLSNSIGVKEISRLISRLRHRQFGVIVTTSYVALQAYQEIKEDDHPIVIISACDIVKIMKARGLAHQDVLVSWLKTF